MKNNFVFWQIQSHGVGEAGGTSASPFYEIIKSN